MEYLKYLFAFVGLIWLGINKGLALLICILPLIQLIFIKKYDFRRILLILIIIMTFIAVLATIFEIMAMREHIETPKNLAYIYILLLSALVSYFLKMWHNRSKSKEKD